MIIGNPSFLGDKKMRAELGDEYVDALRALYGERIPGQSDLVVYWFEKARAMIAAAKELMELPDNWLNPPDVGEAQLKKRTLTNLYNAKPQWLVNAHGKLDAAVLAAYGWDVNFSDDEILEKLLALNLERARG